MAMPDTVETSEGTVSFRGYRTWYQVAGDLPGASGKLPLLVLHGGPGYPHDYLEDLAPLADDGRPVVSTISSAAASPIIPMTSACG